MALILLALWIISICTSLISFMLMLNGKTFVEIVEIIEIEFKRDGHHEYFVEKKVKQMKNSCYFFSFIPIINIIQVYALFGAIKTGTIKEILLTKF